MASVSVSSGSTATMASIRSGSSASSFSPVSVSSRSSGRPREVNVSEMAGSAMDGPGIQQGLQDQAVLGLPQLAQAVGQLGPVLEDSHQGAPGLPQCLGHGPGSPAEVRVRGQPQHGLPGSRMTVSQVQHGSGLLARDAAG